MIPLRDQETLRQRFLRDLTSRVRIDYFTQKRTSLFVAGRQDCPLCEQVRTLMEEVSSLSERITLTVHELSDSLTLAKDLGVDKVPGIVIRGQTNRPVRFFGIPSGIEFPGFIETLIDAARGSVDLKPDTAKQLRRLKSDVRLQVLVTPSCPYCPGIARTAIKLGLQNVRVKVDIIELSEFLALAQRYNVRAVPTTIIDERVVLPGAMDETALVQNLFRVVEGKPLTGAPGGKPGETRVTLATAFNPSPPQAQQPAFGSMVGSSGLVLPR